MAEDSLLYWRARILFTILFTALVVGTLALPPVIVLVIKEKLWRLAIMDGAAWLICPVLLFCRLKYEVRAVITLFMIYLTGLGVIISLGFLSGGPVWLFAFAVLVGVLLGSRAAILAVIINAVTLTILALLLSVGIFGQTFPSFMSIQAMVAAGANFIILNIIAAMSVSVLAKGLVSSHLKEKELTSHLKSERADLMEAKRRLEIEMAERRQAQSELLSLGERYRILFESANDAIFIIEGDQFVDCNDMAVELFGAKGKAQVVGLKVWNFQPSKQPDGVDSKTKAQNYIGTALKGDPQRFYWQCRRLDGAGVDTELSLSRMDVGTKTYILCVARDITEKRALEANLMQAQKMEAIGTLAGGIAHDFNNILSAIMGYTQLLQMKVPEDSDLRKNLDQIFSSSRRAADLVKQILSISRQQAQEQKPIQFRHIAKEVIKMLRATLPTTIVIRDHIASDLGIIHADPTQMHQVLMNLCTNAAHAMQKEGGIIKISLENIRIEKELADFHAQLEPGHYMMLTVTDTGEGMSPEILTHIFDPYFTTKETGQGTGLGLSVVHGIISRHGGAITVDSKIGRGTTFTVYIPLSDSPAPTEHMHKESPLPTGTERILFVDDEPLLVDAGRQVLESLGYHVENRNRPSDALALFRSDPDAFDLVITDTTMPDMTGDRLAKALLKIRPDIPIILCTGYSSHMDKKAAREMGISAFVMKPLSREMLAKTVRKVLDT